MSDNADKIDLPSGFTSLKLTPIIMVSKKSSFLVVILQISIEWFMFLCVFNMLCALELRGITVPVVDACRAV